MAKRIDPVSVLWGLALTAVMLALLVSNSDEFREFCLVPISGGVFYPAVVVVGLISGLVTAGDNTILRLVLFAIILLLPPLIYGTALVLFWVEIGGTTLVQYFILEASRRVLIYGSVMAFIGGFGVIIGFYVSELIFN